VESNRSALAGRGADHGHEAREAFAKDLSNIAFFAGRQSFQGAITAFEGDF
jgi:hypothetical protein